MQDALRFLNEENLKYLPHSLQEEIRTALRLFPYEPDEEHREITGEIMVARQEGTREFALSERIVKAAACRRFLG